MGEGCGDDAGRRPDVAAQNHDCLAGRRDGNDIGVEPVSQPARKLPSPPATPHLPQNLPRPVADRQFRLRSDSHRRIMIAAYPPFGVFVGNEGIPTIAQTRLRPQLPGPLAVLLGDLRVCSKKPRRGDRA